MGTTNSLLVTKLYQNRGWCWSIDWFNWLFFYRLYLSLTELSLIFAVAKQLMDMWLEFLMNTLVQLSLLSMQFWDTLACGMCSLRMCYLRTIKLVTLLHLVVVYDDDDDDGIVLIWKEKQNFSVRLRRVFFLFSRIDISFVCNVRLALNFYF